MIPVDAWGGFTQHAVFTYQTLTVQRDRSSTTSASYHSKGGKTNRHCRISHNAAPRLSNLSFTSLPLRKLISLCRCHRRPCTKIQSKTTFRKFNQLENRSSYHQCCCYVALRERYTFSLALRCSTYLVSLARDIVYPCHYSYIFHFTILFRI